MILPEQRAVGVEVDALHDTVGIGGLRGELHDLPKRVAGSGGRLRA